MKHTKKGFTLIEVMVVISIISLISSILVGSTQRARAKALDVKTVAQAKEVQKSLIINTNNPMAMPDVGDTTNYYCIGKLAAETCRFADRTLNGNAALTSVFANKLTMPTVYVNGQEYNSIVYKCKTRANGVCTESAIYWAQNLGTSCIMGKTVTVGSDGLLCGQNAGTTDITAVETAPSGGGQQVDQCNNQCVLPDRCTEIQPGNWACFSFAAP